ncbi:YbhB/YbcL family Raf kinase inhibitor-like protein [Leucobacter sp. USHLN154]|uniref:YbhB/YbcL family Raf kinase inhibitor-like protein n=1 Tax=Leucobacter sp. USHLN154 TaxID=3081269 RepID=UPI003019CEA3
MTNKNPSRGDIDPYARMRQVPGFTLRSADIQDGEPLPAEQYAEAAGGSNRSPQLSWADFPAGTKSFAVTCFDPDAPTGSGFWHWAVANLPASTHELPAGAGALADTPGGALLPAAATTMPNERRERAFTGAAPPEGTGVHHYWFVVHALGVEHLDIDPDLTPAVMGFMMRDAVLARAVIVATGEFGQAD